MPFSDYRFNHDLLLDEDSLRYVQDSYPKIFPAFDHEVLRKRFQLIDNQANKRKVDSRRAGMLSIFLLSIALMAASSAHYIPVPMASRLVGGAAALVGLVGLAIGAFGVLLRDRKNRWLFHRFETERLRQFFFQTQVVLAPQILHAARTGEWEAFYARRDEAYQTLIEQLDTCLGPTVNASVKASGGEHASSDVWLLRPPAMTSNACSPQDEVEASWIVAYRFLRLGGQLAYANEKLDDTVRSFAKKPVFQQSVIRLVGGATIGGSVLLHLTLALATVQSADEVFIAGLHSGAIWLAIVALAMRTLDEGLRPGEEIERYSAYRDAIGRMLIRFDGATTFEERHATMREMERTSYNELVQFIVSNRSASFAM